MKPPGRRTRLPVPSSQRRPDREPVLRTHGTRTLPPSPGASLKRAADVGPSTRYAPNAREGAFQGRDDVDEGMAPMTGDTPSPRPRALVTGGAGSLGPPSCENPRDAGVAAEVPAADRIVAWFQGRGEYGPHALGHSSPLAHPGRAGDLERLHAAEVREEFRPVAPIVLARRAAGILGGPLPGPHLVADGKARVPAVVHADGTARVRAVDRARNPLAARTIGGFERRTGPPVVVDTGLETVRRPMTDHPRDALRCFGSAPGDLLVPGPSAIRRGKAFG
ncbi:hypothetical protein GCM10010260_46360 [Streptomyces filipinensis]|uniref:Carbamoyltransferase C-terminal domain-containing protein n=2 Tax=Streptomyces filipinensis TaxID=66887 RepID=A0A918IDE8_9ACTN|nr:hypothetical protein GCM10010260_46360 [Streptomyces filipinensis]